MKGLHLILIIIFWNICSQIRAQSVNEEPTPDFSVVDIDGNNYHLYDWLDQGKSVLLFYFKTSDYGALSYINSNALNELYESMGAPGSQSIIVLGIESDPATSNACIYGQSNCGATSLADWTQLLDFPIVNNEQIADLLGVNHFPSISLICPDRIQTQLNTLNADLLRDQIEKCPVPSGNVNAGVYYYHTGAEMNEVCGSTIIQPAFRLVNLGNQALTQAAFTISWQDQLVWSGNWSGYLSRLNSQAITIDTSFSINCAGELTLQVLTNSVDESAYDNYKTDYFTTAKEIPGPQILLRIRTDNYGHETYWEIRDDMGAVVDHGGNEAVGPTGGGVLPANEIGPGSYAGNSTYLEYVNLPSAGCYSFHIVDAFGDGISTPSGYYRIYHQSNENIPIINVTGSTFGAYDEVAFYIGDVVDTEIPEAVDPGALNIAPNPASEQVTIDWSSLKLSQPMLRVFNAAGQMVFEKNAHFTDIPEESLTINVSNWPSGIYTLSIENANLGLRKKISVVHP